MDKYAGRIEEHYVDCVLKMKTFCIYFSDLNEEAQKAMLRFVGVDNPGDMNWDMDILPIARFDIAVD